MPEVRFIDHQLNSLQGTLFGSCWLNYFKYSRAKKGFGVNISQNKCENSHWSRRGITLSTGDPSAQPISRAGCRACAPEAIMPRTGSIIYSAHIVSKTLVFETPL
jgi:hypothetical protein